MALPTRAQEVLASPAPGDDGAFRWPSRSYTGVRCRSLHLYALLSHAGPRHLGLLPRLLETYIAFAPRGLSSFRMALPLWLKEKLFLKDLLTRKLTVSAAELGLPDKLLFAEHHVSHAASAFFPSPFEDALVLTMDGVGEWATTSAAIGNGNRLAVTKEIHF